MISSVSDSIYGYSLLTDTIGNVLYAGMSIDPVLRLIKSNGGVAELYSDIQWRVED